MKSKFEMPPMAGGEEESREELSLEEMVEAFNAKMKARGFEEHGEVIE